MVTSLCIDDLGLYEDARAAAKTRWICLILRNLSLKASGTNRAANYARKARSDTPENQHHYRRQPGVQVAEVYAEHQVRTLIHGHTTDCRDTLMNRGRACGAECVGIGIKLAGCWKWMKDGKRLESFPL